MAGSLIWITGASSGIGAALARTLPWEGARVIGVSRRVPPVGEHLQLDLTDVSSWGRLGASFRKELTGFEGDRVAFIHAAGTLEPIGFAGEVDPQAYQQNVLLNSAAPQVLGQLFLAAVRDVSADRHVLMLTSGAATSVYPGWSSYGAGKAAIDQWVRDAGAEQDIRGGVTVVAVAPGTVDTGMQARLRDTTEDDFPKRQKFFDLHQSGQLSDRDQVGRQLWALLDRDLDNGSVLDLRELAESGGAGP
ncbi:MAG TPA: SDR family NAD(P)-dependent oxidoreductase [Acidimicrobiales bacterium]|nr:SDR family NAD(P)-dependent oxidoreductase [Acidimicrobiales bacterium]